MIAATLTKRITIRQRSAGVDAAGQPVETWVDLATIWADIRFLNGSEFAKSSKEINLVQASIRTRKRSDITASMRAVYDGNTYNIVAVLPQTMFIMDLAVERV